LRLISEPRQGLAAEQIDSESVVVSGAIFARGCQIEEIKAPENHEGSRLFVARCEMQSSHLPTVPWDVHCDWVEARGKLVSGQEFSTRSLLCFQPR
jgi:hypothetical protein